MCVAPPSDLSAALQLAPTSKVASEGVMRLTKTLRQQELAQRKSSDSSSKGTNYYRKGGTRGG
eukprot:507170-Prorocentrum_minimum.AAC.2